MTITYPFELPPPELTRRMDEMVDTIFSSLQSQFLVLPRGSGFVDYEDFEKAYQALRRATKTFEELTEEAVWQALEENALTFVVLRTILGFSPPEWADLATSETSVAVPQNAIRTLDRRVREVPAFFIPKARARRKKVTQERCEALVRVAIDVLERGAPEGSLNSIHRLAKADTQHGLGSLQHVAQRHVPYAMLLYERYLGRPFASHRDAVSELVGDVMEDAIERRLERAGITYRRTGRAERIPGFDQAPDFFVPDEYNAQVLIEAKITQDDGTARDKVARILRLAEMRDRAVRDGKKGFQLVACIDGRGFGVRRQDMMDLLRATKGKIFTLCSLEFIVSHSELDEFVPS